MEGNRYIRRMTKAVISSLLVSGILWVGLGIYKNAFEETYQYIYEAAVELPPNPLIGFAQSADYVEAVGNNTLVYVDVTWRELEPREGEYAFDAIAQENNLARWRAEGKNVVFRFICDKPSGEAHMDIPDWLYEKTKDGDFYDMVYGKGYSPDYNNVTFQTYHKKAIEALGKAYGTDSFFAYIELGSVGHWGEWHVKYDEGIKRIPSEEVCMKYIEPYVAAFPHAKLLMRRPFWAVDTYGFGVYNDMTGAEIDTAEWLSWINNGGSYEEAQMPLRLLAQPRIWERAPIGGEFTSDISMEEMLLTQQSRTLSLLQQSHMTFIGPKCPIACGEEIQYPEAVQAIRDSVGYRYGLERARITYNKLQKDVQITFSIKNRGVAPIYFDWKCYLYVLDEEEHVIERIQTNIDLRRIAQGQSLETSVKLSLREWINERGEQLPLFAVGIENPEKNEPAVYLDMNTRQSGKKYVLNP